MAKLIEAQIVTECCNCGKHLICEYVLNQYPYGIPSDCPLPDAPECRREVGLKE